LSVVRCPLLTVLRQVLGLLVGKSALGAGFRFRLEVSATVSCFTLPILQSRCETSPYRNNLQISEPSCINFLKFQRTARAAEWSRMELPDRSIVPAMRPEMVFDDDPVGPPRVSLVRGSAHDSGRCGRQSERGAAAAAARFLAGAAIGASLDRQDIRFPRPSRCSTRSTTPFGNRPDLRARSKAPRTASARRGDRS
jgi:hypothetical protein